MPPVKEIVVISGKGGTGKTSIAGGLAYLLQPLVMADYDVDAANFHLAMGARRTAGGPFHAGWEPCIDEVLCTRCGLCGTVCRWQAISAGEIVSPLACEGCGTCGIACPNGAIKMVESLAGEWILSETPCGPLVHAALGPGRENSGKLVAMVKDEARRIAEKSGRRLLLGDGPPGIACAVIAALSRADIALVVTEPSLSGEHDLRRVLDLCRHFRIRPCVCLNKHDLWPEGARRIQALCDEEGIDIPAMIPVDESVPRAARKGVNIMEFGSDKVKRSLTSLAGALSDRLSRHEQYP